MLINATLKQSLNSYSAEDLKGLVAQFNPPSPCPTHKDAVIEVLLHEYEGDGLRNMWSRLDYIQQAAVSEILYSADLHLHLDTFGPKHECKPETYDTSKKYRSGRAALAIYCLFVFDGTIPLDLVPRLLEFVPKPESMDISTLEAAPTSQRQQWRFRDSETNELVTKFVDVPITSVSTESIARKDLISVLRLIEAGRVKISEKTSQPTPATTREITALRTDGDYYNDDLTIEGIEFDKEHIGPIRAFAWPLLLQVGGLATTSGPRLDLTPVGTDALTAPAADTLRSLWKTWLTNTAFDELRRIEVIKGQTGRGQVHLTRPSDRRISVERGLSDCPVGRWILVEDFLKHARKPAYRYVVSTNPNGLYAIDSSHGSLADDGDLVESRYLYCFLLEYVATLGMIDVAYFHPRLGVQDYRHIWGGQTLEFFSRYDGLVAICLNPLGAYCLGLTKEYVCAEAQASPVLRVLPNREIVLTAERVSPADIFILDLCARKISDSVWRLDQEKLVMALENGKSIDTLTEFLLARSKNELPDTVTQFFADVTGRARQLAFAGPAIVIDCPSPDIAALIANSTQVRRHCQRASDQSLVVREADEAAFRRGVRKLGYVLPTRERK